MIPRIGKVAGLLLFVFLLSTSPTLAQLEVNLQGLSDANTTSFVGPLNTALSSTMNAAIFRTGDVPKEDFHFMISVAAMAVGFDDEDKVYLPEDPTGFTATTPTEVPTIIGDPSGAAVAGANGLYEMYPGGLDLEGFEIGVPELQIGNVMGTTAKIRYIALELGDSELGDFKYTGFGLQHSISQYFTDFPVDLAAGFFIQSFNIGSDLIKAKTTYMGITASKQYGLFQPYVGIGLDTVKSEIYSKNEDYEDFTVDLDMDKESDMHFTLGAAAKTSAIGLFFEFNTAAATGFALGLQFGN